MDFYRRNLPHFLPNDAPYFVTSRLAGTLPRPRQEAKRLTFVEFDRMLDANDAGPTWLRESSIAKVICDSFHHFNHMRYELIAFTVMPNHFHLMLRLRKEESLDRVLQSLKRYSARKCNEILGRTGAFWQEESYDHVVRSHEHGRIIAYILNNPVKAHLCHTWREWPHTYLDPELSNFF